MHSLYWVLIASLVVYGGLFGYLLSCDARVRKLERRLDREEERE